MKQDTSTVPQKGDHPIEFKIEKILVPLDFSPASMEALDYAVSLAKQFHAAIHLVHVYPPDEASSVPGAAHLLFNQQRRSKGLTRN
jgi:nucleotide-binding universal stress UspA family protein